MSNEKKAPLYNNVILPLPENSGRTVLNLREGADMYQKDLSKALKLRARTGISEYERNVISISKQAFSLLAILTGAHPMVKKGKGELVFEVNPEPKEGYAAFVRNALDKQGITADELVQNEYASKSKLKIETVTKVLNGDAPRDKEWSNIQLALGQYASGFDYAKIIESERNKRNWDQDELARLVGISNQSISNYETRKSIPGVHIWAILLLVFGIHPNYKMINRNIPDNYLDKLEDKIKSIEEVRTASIA